MYLTIARRTPGEGGAFGTSRPLWRKNLIKTLLTMKFTAIVLLSTCLQVRAIGYAQITLSESNTPLQTVFKKIQKQSGYDFLYSYELLQKEGNVSVKVRNVSLQQALEECLKGKGLGFEIQGATVVIMKRTQPPPPVNVQPLPPIEITGRVVDEQGEPISGVTIVLKGSSKGTSTNEQGFYTFTLAQAKGTLVFSHIGYVNREVILGNNKVINIELKKESSSLEDIVVVAYGTQKKSDLTGSSSSIKSGALRNLPVISIEELFKGQAAGVQASVASGTPGSASNINIRGVSSIGASTQPLYVIDGLPVSGQSIETDFSEARTGMDFINPADIESIEILKDASATSIYGARGANGVILITTKSGKAGNNTVNFSSSMGVTTISNKIKMMTTRQAQEYWELGKARVGRVETSLNPDLLDINTDWQGETSQTALRQNYNASFQGGQQRLQYYLSLDYIDQDGLLKYTNYNKYSIRANVSSQVNDKLKIDNRITIGQTRNDGSFTGGQGGTANATGATQRIIQAPTYLRVNADNPGVDPETGETYIDPLVILRDLSDDIRVTNITEQLTAKYNILPNLEWQTMGGITYRFFKNDQYQGEGFAATKGDKRISAKVSNSTTLNYINENTVTYRKKIGRHNFTVLLGNTIQQEVTDGSSINAVDFPSTVTGTNALQNAREITVSSFKQQWQLASFFGRLNYTLNNKYLLTATVRRDGSSKLAQGNKWGTFPSVALGWNISNEPFFQRIQSISNLKLRASWGQIGNSDIGTYRTLTTINSGTSGFDNVLLPYYTLGSYGDPNLKWEVSEQTNLGFDMELLRGRISITVDVFEKKTRDLLLAQPTSLSAGYGSYLTNVGSMSNKGVEFTFNFNVLQTKAFQWTTNFNFSLLRNRITDLGNEGIVAVGQNIDGKSPRYLSVGKSIGTFYLVKTAGVWQLGEEAAAAEYGAIPGDWKFEDQNNKDKIIDNDDRVFMGDALPDFSCGFSNTFRYKKLDLQVLISGDFGGQTLNAIKPTLLQARKGGAAAYGLDAWSPANPTNKLPAPNIFYNTEFLHDGYLEDADIVRLQNVRLGYRLNPTSWKKTSLYFYFSGNNLWSWSEYDGYDPEVGNGINRGIDRFSYPRGRIYTFGAQLTF